MENVEGLLSSNNGRDFALVLDAMAERGYRWSYRVLDSQHFAVPQRRVRVFVCAVADDDPRAERIAEVLALGEGSDGDSPTRNPSWPDVASRARAGAPSSSGDDAVIERERERESRSRRHGQVGEGQRRTCRGRVPEPRPRRRVVGTLTAQYGEQAGQDLAYGGGLVTRDDVPEDVRAFRKSARVNADPDSPETWVDDGLANTLNGFDVGDVRTTHAVVQATAFAQNQRGELRESDVAPAVTSGGGKPGEGYSAARVGPAVRRLTPLECERLQAWPEVDGRGWTDIPWNGKEHAPDSKRYAAAGNGVTATVAYWIAARLAEVLK